MGKEFVVESLEDMCLLMCDNYIPKRRKHNDSNRVSGNRQEYSNQESEQRQSESKV